VISEQRGPNHGAKVRYRLTSKGTDLLPVLLAMMRWSLEHDADSPVPAELRERVLHDPEGLVADWRARPETSDPAC